MGACRPAASLLLCFVCCRFLERGDYSRLATKFSRDEQELYAAPYLCSPAAPASDRCALRRMKVQAPCTGTYRFLGLSDGALAMLLRGGETALRAGVLLQQPSVATGEKFTVKMGGSCI